MQCERSAHTYRRDKYKVYFLNITVNVRSDLDSELRPCRGEHRHARNDLSSSSSTVYSMKCELPGQRLARSSQIASAHIHHQSSNNSSKAKGARTRLPHRNRPRAKPSARSRHASMAHAGLVIPKTPKGGVSAKVRHPAIDRCTGLE